MKTVRSLLFLIACAVFAHAAAPRAAAQDALPTSDPIPSPRYGISITALYSTPQGGALGLTGRASLPINEDLSAALDIGFAGFVFQGWRDADYLFEPRLSLIVTPPTTRLRAAYVFFGVGGYLPLATDKDARGPTVHVGIGRAHGFGDSAVFYEINPTLIISSEKIGFSLPARLGIIF